jgi:two-component system sensor histidine kinase KdpD
MGLDAKKATMVRRSMIGCAALALSTYALFSLHANVASAGFLYLLVVVVIAMRYGFGVATLASLIAVACLDYYFIPPVFTLNVTQEEDAAALITFECSAVIVSRLSARAKQQAHLAGVRYSERQKLYQLSRGVLLSDPARPVGSQILGLLRDVLEVDSAAIFNGLDATCQSYGPEAEEAERIARDAYLMDRGNDDADRHRWSRTLRLGGKPVGSIAMASRGLNTELVDAVASLCAIAIERGRAMDRAAHAEASKQSEQLRGAVLDALAHAFKTPLTTIRAASSGLLEFASFNAAEATLIKLIDQESERLDKLATQLLRTARLDNLTFRPAEDCNPHELIRQIVQELAWTLKGHPVKVNAPVHPTLIRADRELLTMGLTQLIDNAAKYSPPSSSITISVSAADSATIISVHNSGPVIPQEQRERIFDRFYRAPGSEYLAPGTGLGLSITRRAAEAHQGLVWVESTPENGTTFFLSIPETKISAEPPREEALDNARVQQLEKVSDRL